MTNTPKTTPKDFFLYIGVMAALYVSTLSILTLWFRIIDSFFVDPLAYFDPYSTGISLSIASLLIIFPAFLALSWIIHRDEKKNPEKREIKIRKWLIYLTLFVAGGVIIIDLIVLLNRFLSGQEITAAFVWKVVAVLVVIGAVFAYYLYKVRSQISDSTGKILAVVAVVAVIASIVIGFMVMGSPQEQRGKRFDQERISNLQNIQWQIVNYWQQKEELPETLEELGDPLRGFTAPTDPETGETYRYTVSGALSFELCAVFNNASSAESPRAPALRSPEFPSGSKMDESWAHEAGEYCFERTIDPELYPPHTNQ